VDSGPVLPYSDHQLGCQQAYQQQPQQHNRRTPPLTCDFSSVAAAAAIAPRNRPTALSWSAATACIAAANRASFAANSKIYTSRSWPCATGRPLASRHTQLSCQHKHNSNSHSRLHTPPYLPLLISCCCSHRSSQPPHSSVMIRRHGLQQQSVPPLQLTAAPGDPTLELP
jgi:hypothetical protein